MLAWTLVGLVGIQVVLNLFLELRHPEIYDPEYRDRLVLLQQRLRDEPDRPLLLLVGSSRMITDFRPETLPPLKPSADEQALPFNFSHTGAGPLLTLMQVRRLIRLGIHPKWMVVEIVPSMLAESAHVRMANLALASDLPVLRRHVTPSSVYKRYLWERLQICNNHPDACLRSITPWTMNDAPEWDAAPLEPLGGSMDPVNVEMTPAETRRRTDFVRDFFQEGLQQLRINETSAKAMRELLDLAHDEKIELVLLLAPESSEFRSWYSQESWTEVDNYCKAIASEHGVSLVNARDWLPDEGFSDGHHAIPAAAVEFTSRLGRDVLKPLVEGRLHANGGPPFLAGR